MKTILAVSALMLSAVFTAPAVPCRSCGSTPPQPPPVCYYGVTNPFSGTAAIFSYAGGDAFEVCEAIASDPTAISAVYCDDGGCSTLL